MKTESMNLFKKALAVMEDNIVGITQYGQEIHLKDGRPYLSFLFYRKNGETIIRLRPEEFRGIYTENILKTLRKKYESLGEDFEKEFLQRYFNITSYDLAALQLYTEMGPDPEYPGQILLTVYYYEHTVKWPNDITLTDSFDE